MQLEQRPNYQITKRQLGLAFLILGILGFIGLLALNIIRHKPEGIGPTQQLALAGFIGLALLGLSLIPFGDRPA